MLLWAILTIVAVIVAAALTVPLVRRWDARPGPRDANLAMLRDSLADVDVQAASGAVAPSEAEALRTEIKRRMLGASRAVDAAPRPLGQAALGRLAIVLTALVGVAATALYATLGRPDLASPPPPAVAAPADPATPGNAEVASMVGKLEARLKTQPNDAQGWQMLGWSNFQLSRYREASVAYARAVALAPQTPGNASAYGEALVQAAGGIVTPDARAQFAAANRLDAGDPRARYFLGLAKQQANDPKGALDDWFKLLSESPADAPYTEQLRRIIADTASSAKIDVTARLAVAASGRPGSTPPAATSAGVTAPPNPSADQVAAVQAMAPVDQQAMIRSMVDRLAGKLKANPADPDGWIRLIRARMVIGDRAAAGAARDDAVKALGGDAAGAAKVRAAATELGV